MLAQVYWNNFLEWMIYKIYFHVPFFTVKFVWKIPIYAELGKQ